MTINFNKPNKVLQNDIASTFSDCKWDTPDLKNGCIDQPNVSFELNPTQNFIKKFVKVDNPNGILLWHSVGSGKTLSAVATLKEWEDLGYSLLWITRTTLKKDLFKATTMIPLKSLTVLSYKQFSNIGKFKGEIYNSLLRKAKRKSQNTNDPLYKTIVVIDEAHKLYTKDLKPQEMHDISKIQNLIFKSYNSDTPCKVILMSATPITENSIEIIYLLNLIIQKSELRFNVDNFKKELLDSEGKIKDPLQFQEKIKGLVSYIDMSKDPRKFAQIEYSETLVPISSPNFSINFEKRLKNCDSGYAGCLDLGFNKKFCSDNLKDCRMQIKQQQSLIKKGKFQNTMISTKCGTKLN